MSYKPGLPWHNKSFSEAMSDLSVDLSGLSAEEVLRRREKYGRNVLQGGGKESFIKRTLRGMKSPLVLILLCAGLLTLILREFFDATVIFIALAVNVIIGLVQEGRASRAFEKLSSSQEAFAEVVRDGKRMRIRSEDLVPGDVVILEQGGRVPADLRLLKTNSLEIDEAVLTGESTSVMKESAHTVSKDAPLAERKNMAFMGTVVAGGFGKGVVVASGIDTELGKIAGSLSAETAVETPIQKNMAKLARFLMWVVLAVIVVIFVLGLLRGEALTDLILLSIAVAVSVVPEGLPAAVTAVLAVGMEHILSKGGLVRNLLAAETLGATTVILTDKTGTLTEAKMTLESIFTLGASLEIRESAVEEGDLKELLTLGVLASDAFIEESDSGNIVRGRPLERALPEAGILSGIDQREVLDKNKRVDYLPFESERRFEASLHEDINGEKMIVYSGSPEKILSMSGKVLLNGREKALSKESIERFEKVVEEKTKEGMRFIAVSYSKDSDEIDRDNASKADFSARSVFAGVLAFSDPIRPDVADAVATAQKAGAKVLMLTGDHPGTAKYVAGEVGIAGSEKGVRTGVDISRMSDDELRISLEEITVYARMAPEDKLRVARILKERGETIAMTGDGVNDAPALRFASIGVAVESGTEVAKEASDLILLKNSFSIIVSAIEEGRRILDNLKKVVTHLISTSFGEVFVIAGAMVFGLPLPILPVQILWVNIIEEGLLNFAFAFEPAEKGVMSRKPGSASQKVILDADVRSLIFLVGAVTGIVIFISFVILERMGLPIEEVRTMVFIMLSLNALFFTLSIKNFRHSIFKTNLLSNKFLLLALGINFLLILVTIFTPQVRNILSLSLISYTQVGVLILIALVNISVIEIVKYFIFVRKR